jgi:hypothetical protein
VSISLSVGDQQATLVANGIPHCTEHSGGVVLNRVFFANAGGVTAFGLCFRWSFAARLGSSIPGRGLLEHSDHIF